MNLSEVLTTLLAAEDEAADSVEDARRKAADILRENREKFAAEQEARLGAARAQAKAIVESARHSAEMEAAQIADMGMRARQKMKDQFAEKAPQVVSQFAKEIAERYEKKGGA
ncbi:ATPase [Aminivibrio sp.]|jgi:V/A-type H+-transporting ATPase subunit G/H/F-type H+-transporting ATPase subunit b|uniref:ATPase n=1 Tax=Aminivibrio sp. TaxID=1872489 RepID=UPI001A43267E|nr:ATPase [Aminivibrio sp.]MBL3540041.1 ATPase [Aminivibrio sp.]MDK2958857.1 V/A-type H+/Na+-transporting ATPase subunit [Synergistaceae bacterium]